MGPAFNQTVLDHNALTRLLGICRILVCSQAQVMTRQCECKYITPHVLVLYSNYADGPRAIILLRLRAARRPICRSFTARTLPCQAPGPQMPIHLLHEHKLGILTERHQQRLLYYESKSSKHTVKRMIGCPKETLLGARKSSGDGPGHSSIRFLWDTSQYHGHGVWIYRKLNASGELWKALAIEAWTSAGDSKNEAILSYCPTQCWSSCI